jgi:hypothetical protein
MGAHQWALCALLLCSLRIAVSRCIQHVSGIAAQRYQLSAPPCLCLHSATVYSAAVYIQFDPNPLHSSWRCLQAADYNVSYPLVQFGYVAELKGDRVPSGLGLTPVRAQALLGNLHCNCETAYYPTVKHAVAMPCNTCLASSSKCHSRSTSQHTYLPCQQAPAGAVSYLTLTYNDNATFLWDLNSNSSEGPWLPIPPVTPQFTGTDPAYESGAAWLPTYQDRQQPLVTAHSPSCRQTAEPTPCLLPLCRCHQPQLHFPGALLPG